MENLYHRVQVNNDLLNGGNVDDAKKGMVSDIIPYKGKLKGIYFIPYSKDCGCKEAGKTEYHHTEIRIEDTRGRLLTGVTDIRDYLKESWAGKGYKEVHFPFEQNERIVINYNTTAGNPIAGEFVFIIEGEENNCDL